MHPALIAAMATFGVQKLRGKSTSRALRDSIMAAGFTYGVGEIGAGIEALGANTAAATQASNLAASGGTTMEALNIAKGIGADSALLQVEPFVGSATNIAGASSSNLPLYGVQNLSPIAQGTKDFLGSTGDFGKNVSEAYQSGIGKFKQLDPMTQFAVKYGTAPVLTALLTPDELPKGMSQEEFMKLDSETRARLLAEAKEDVKGLGDRAEPRRTQSFPYDYTQGNPLYTPFNKGGIYNVSGKNIYMLYVKDSKYLSIIEPVPFTLGVVGTESNGFNFSNIAWARFSGIYPKQPQTILYMTNNVTL